MSYSWCIQCYLLITLSTFNIVRTVPPDYCLSPLNRSNCNMEPTPVFSYYKPGSRCEVQMWRGCPTVNKFANEYLCSLHCLFRMSYKEEEEEEEIEHEPLKVIDECETPLNTEHCTKEISTVFTHVNGTCIEATWSGCKTFNKFENKTACETKCGVKEIDLQIELEKLDPEPLEEINEVLKHIIEEETTEAVTETTTETIETTTEPVTETTAADYAYVEVENA